MKGRTQAEWLVEFDNWLKENEAFYNTYLKNEVFTDLKIARSAQNIRLLFSMLNEIWFNLPDRIFNIMENPQGWREFLHLIEFWDEMEYHQIVNGLAFTEN